MNGAARSMLPAQDRRRPRQAGGILAPRNP